MDDTRLIQGVALFNSKRFFECHEEWEELWMDLRGEQKLFVQSLIQLAVAYYHCENGNYRGGRNLFSRGLEKLSHFPDHYLNIDVSSLRAEASRHEIMIHGLEQLDEPPFADADIPELRIIEHPPYTSP